MALAALAVVVAHAARAEACPPAVALSGDADLVRAVREQLELRGIAGEIPACPALHARIERRGPQVMVEIDPEVPGGSPIERSVNEPVTAATVIESFTRSDVTAPLLSVRAVPDSEDRADAAVVAAPPSSPGSHGIQLFAAEETSFANDRTTWEGMELGACVRIGALCAAGRLRGGTVISGPMRSRGFSRKGAEVYVGVDVPIALGSARLSVGVAAGYGSMFTLYKTDGEKMGLEMTGPRAEAHAGFSLPLSSHIALDFLTTGELVRATQIETDNDNAGPAPEIRFPDAPRALLRFAIGVRYGAL